jgi:hypothetical protein
MVLLEIYGSYIDANPMKSKTEGAMIKAYLILWEQLTTNGTVELMTTLWTMRHQLDTKKKYKISAQFN